MPMSAQMSLWGLLQVDPTILDGLIVPTGMDADNVKANLMLETESMEILYPKPVFLKAAITVWAAERKEVWDKLYATTVLTYNPIENYDRMEDSLSSTFGSAKGKSTGVASATSYNSDDFKDTGKSVNDSDSSSNSSGTFRSHIHGNIGVTTSQQMIQSERDLVQFCMTEYIINDFISRFCVGVY